MLSCVAGILVRCGDSLLFFCAARRTVKSGTQRRRAVANLVAILFEEYPINHHNGEYQNKEEKHFLHQVKNLGKGKDTNYTNSFELPELFDW